MNTVPIHHYSKEQINSLMRGVPFLRELSTSEPEQFEILMSYSQFVEPEPGEVIIEKGDNDPWLYFILKGQLVVYPEIKGSPLTAVNYISAGEIVGALALIQNEARGATVTVDPSVRKTLLLGIHFAVFDELSNFNFLNLKTKLDLVKMINHNTRWQVEQYRAQYPSNPLGLRLNALSVYRGKKNTIDHLQSLYRDTQELGKMLREWNIALQFSRRYQSACQHPINYHIDY